MKQFYIKAYNSAVKYANNQLRKMVWARPTVNSISSLRNQERLMLAMFISEKS